MEENNDAEGYDNNSHSEDEQKDEPKPWFEQNRIRLAQLSYRPKNETPDEKKKRKKELKNYRRVKNVMFYRVLQNNRISFKVTTYEGKPSQEVLYHFSIRSLVLEIFNNKYVTR